jgi:DNA-binding LacI/PurR family transcriptional regulator
MPATFDPALTAPRDRLRFRLGDTDMTKPLLDDTTYDGQLAHQGNDERKALQELAKALIARFAQRPNRVKAGDVEATWQERLPAWREIVAEVTATTATAVGIGMSTRSPYRGDRGETGEYRR